MPTGKRKTTGGQVLPHTPHTSISVPIETAIKVTFVSIGVAATIWATTSGLRSDVRDILTQMKAETEKREMQERLVDERMGTLRETVNDQKRRLELVQYELNGLKELVMKLPQK